jgi:hypothetical protein
LWFVEGGDIPRGETVLICFIPYLLPNPERKKSFYRVTAQQFSVGDDHTFWGRASARGRNEEQQQVHAIFTVPSDLCSQLDGSV